ncbi:ABC transporter substrate-binding protein [Saccharomonospora sp. NPDC046836]|uniref:ABC transporter substrate-binding protein n=1 Tax=Saccharomonospora sp. NPDC046836 TaxID=3156921 RepID=UPI0034112FA6
MIRKGRFLAATVTCVAAAAMAGCSGPTAGSPEEPVGDPVAGGTAHILMITEPRALDPAVMSNVWALNAVLGNALYGTLLTNDENTGEIHYEMAESFTTEDNGVTFELMLRQGLTFSDGSPLDAEAVKFNWDRLRDPVTGSTAIRDAALIASTEVVDARTLEVTLRTPVPNYAQAVVANQLNWIASPKALQAGPQAFDANPVGAGPFTLKSWTRQDRIELVRNPGYWDAPKPYLDAITLRAAPDTTQRLNTLTSGGADVAVETNWSSIATARERGVSADVQPLGGGQGLSMNMRRAPFNDERARKAVAAALDLKAIDLAVYNGKGEIPATLFVESSPFYSDFQLTTQDKATAQRLFDELAAEGKKVSFTFTSYPTPEAKGAAESVQAQLSAFDNVDVSVQTVDFGGMPRIYAEHDFDMIISSSLLLDPEPQLWTNFHGQSPANMSGVDDEQLNEALQAGRTSTSVAERKAAYQVVQERLSALVPTIFYTRASPSVLAAENVHGVVQYGFGSLLPEELWIAQ